MAVSMIGPKFYAWDRSGKPLAFGKLFTYQARTNTPKATYQSEDQQVENTNPVILNGEGYADVYLSGSYKMVLKDDKGNEIWSSDPVSAAQPDEWVKCLPATYVSPTSFRVNGNFTSDYEPGRRVRIDNGVTEYSYSTIESSTFAAGETTVVVLDPVVTTGVQEVCASIVGPESRPVREVLNFSTLQKAVDATYIKEGGALNIKEREEGIGGGAMWDAVLASSVTPNDLDVVQSSGVPTLAFVLRVQEFVSPEMYGAKGDDSTLDSDALEAMYLNGKTKLFVHAFGRTYLHDGRSLIIPEGANIVGNNSEYKIQPGSYENDNLFFLKNSDNINYSAAIPRMAQFNIVGLKFNGNRANVTITDASCNALWFHQCDDIQIDNVKIFNMPGDNGGQAGIVFRFCNRFQVNNPDINNTDRQGIQCWESRGEINGGFIGVSRFREPVLISSEDVPSFQGSHCIVSHLDAGNIGTESGTHVLRFSGKSSGAIKHCDIQGQNTLNGIYITFGLDHNIELIDNDIRDCLYGVKVESTGPKQIMLDNNRYHDCENGLRCVAGGTDASITSLNEKFFNTVTRPINIDFMPNVKVEGAFIVGGSSNVFINNYKTLSFNDNNIKDMTFGSYAVSLGARSGDEIASVIGNTISGNASDDITTSEDVFARDNTLGNFIGSGIKLGRIGRAYVWSSAAGKLYINTSLPANETDGTVVGTQT